MQDGYTAGAIQLQQKASTNRALQASTNERTWLASKTSDGNTITTAESQTRALNGDARTSSIINTCRELLNRAVF